MTIQGAMRAAAAAGAVALILSGCGGPGLEPTESDVKAAFAGNAEFMKFLQDGQDFSASTTGRPALSAAALMDSATMERSTCVPASGAGGYVCGVRVGLVTPCINGDAFTPSTGSCDGKPIFSAWSNLRFWQDGGKWQVEMPR